ncbi:hypothetical protein [uncultured Limimaricola sp.]|uniref:hypothetical protein n=1 Tax=uncultured Limimaricola sp. TaxID=2211667 RepID=UPI0030FC6812
MAMLRKAAQIMTEPFSALLQQAALILALPFAVPSELNAIRHRGCTDSGKCLIVDQQDQGLC